MYRKFQELLAEKAQVDCDIRKYRVINCRSYAVLFEKSDIKDDTVKSKLAELERALSKMLPDTILDEILDDLEATIEEVVDKQ